MNFRNSYISIFNQKINNPKSFLKVFLFFIVLTHSISFLLNRLGLNITNNDVIADYQIQKINDKTFDEIDTIFVGDSSLGNAIDKKLFNSISKLRSENLSLTGSFGIAGSLGMIKKSLKKNPNIKNFIIVQTLDIWAKPYAKEAILELYPLKDMRAYLDNSSIFSYFFNPKEIYWYTKYLLKKNTNSLNLYTIDLENDYILQKFNKYSNNKIKIKKNYTLDKVTLSNGKSKEIKMIDSFCMKKNINCLFLNGPIHKGLIGNSKLFLKYKDNVISKQFRYINYFPNIFAYEGFMMGDTADHIDTNYKSRSTIDIYKVIKDHLIY